jgi:hypothetical protein
MNWPDLVRHWHDLMTLDGMRDKPGQPTMKSRAIGWRILQEEWDELYDASCDVSGTPARLAQVAKELCDLIWTAIAFGLRYGLPMDECFAELYRSNCTKTPGLTTQGKLDKGPDYEPADMESIIRGAIDESINP